MNEQIENKFKYHAPKEVQPEKYTTIREKAKEFAYLIDELCPNLREKSIAITNLETAVMWANAAIAKRSALKTITLVHFSVKRGDAHV